MLSLTEDCNIIWLVLVLVCLKLAGVEVISKWLEFTARLTHNYASEGEELLPLECPVEVGVEFTMFIECFTHSEFWVRVFDLVCLFSSFPKITEHFIFKANVIKMMYARPYICPEE